jgi:Leucine-rich repeat (LRR) protein
MLFFKLNRSRLIPPKNILALCLALFTNLLAAQQNSNEAAMRFAEDFFLSQTSSKKGTTDQPDLLEIYSSPDTANTKIYCIQNTTGGFVMVSENKHGMAIAGYATDGSPDPAMMPPTLKALISFYESSEKIAAGATKGTSATSVVTPLLDREGVALNQYYHASVGNCPSGCAATAMAQIMCYYKYPNSGVGSNCYTHSVYGELCADFENTVYNWTSMSDADYELLSYHVGIAMDMNYCGDPSGSVPSNEEYTEVLEKYFGYHVHSGTSESFYIYNELDNGRPVYASLPGDPGHAVVLDGYDSQGYFHINFGWGGNYNGYYQLNAGGTFEAGYLFGTNLSRTRYISPQPFRTDEQDSLALIAFHQAMNEKTGWDLSQPVAKWPGVVVMNERVVQIKILNHYLEGVIPDEIGLLTELQRLDIKGVINGPVPSSFFQLTKLKSIAIRGTGQTEKALLTPEIGNLTQLESLELTNFLKGPIPATIGNLTKLATLNLSAGELTGEIPAEMFNHTNLEVLNLSNNQLTGTLAASLGQLTKLRYFSVWNNQLSGPLPNDIENLTLLKEFDVSVNQFSGEFPGNLSGWTNITRFSIADNQFEGTFPPAVGGFAELQGLKISNNRFTALPDEIGDLVNLQTLEASNNLIGALPASISRLQSLYRLYLDNNKLTTLPDMGTMPALWDLNLSYNEITDLPESFGNLVKVYDLYLGYNQITQLPASFEKLTSVRLLALSGNLLTTVPSSFCFMSGLKELTLTGNRISNPLPPLSHLGLTWLDIRKNRLVFSDIAASSMPDDRVFTDDYTFSYQDQAAVALRDTLFSVTAGEQVSIDVRTISRLSHPDNEYEWYRNNELHSSGPVLNIQEFSASDEGNYYCQVRNSAYGKLLVLQTDSLVLKIEGSDLFEDGNRLTSRSEGGSALSDNMVKLVPAPEIRGSISWEASVDGESWYVVSDTMTNETIKENILSVEGDSVIAEPVNNLLFRYKVEEGSCDPLYSDTIRLLSFGTMLLDTLLDAGDLPLTIAVDSIEIVVPAYFSDGVFRLTVKKLHHPPAAPEGLLPGSVYDVNVSVGNVFDHPLLIRMKNFDKEMITAEEIDKVKAVYYDDEKREWVVFEDARVSLKDSTLCFETSHLTKLSWWWDEEVAWGYTDVFMRNNVRVFYKDKDTDRFNLLYGKNQTAQPWHLSAPDPEAGTPIMIQDVAHFLHEVMEAFRSLNLPVPDHDISVFVQEMDDYGSVGLMGMLNHYLNINRDIDNPGELRSLMAHEFMHYIQDSYIAAHSGNIFWMEAHAHLSDRMVWDKSVIPVSESEQYLLNGRSGNTTIFQFLANSWDYWDKHLFSQNLLGDVNYCYMAGTFLHYMRSYRTGEKLQPDILLKETPYLQSWLNYLDSYVQQYLASDIGKEYEAFIKYIVEGSNGDFALLNKTEGEDPLKYFKTAPAEFMTNKYYRFDADAEQGTLKDSIKLELPYLSTKMVQMYNLNVDHQKVLVKYRRKSEGDPNCKVYLCKYDNANGMMTMEDVSAIDSAVFIIDSPTGSNVEEKRHIAWFMFINKDKSKDFAVNYELELFAVPEISFFDGFSFRFGVYPSEASIHYFNDGTNEFSGQFHLIPAVYRIYADDYYSPVSYNVDITDEMIIIDASSDWIEQSVVYNFMTGAMTISNKENWGGLTPTSKIDMREIRMELSNVWLKPLDGGDSRFTFSTDNTAQTQEVVQSISYTRKLALYNYEKGEHNPTVTTTYVRTAYDSDNIRFHLYFY